MRFKELNLTGAFLIAPEPREDARGFFARTWCRREFEAHGIRCEHPSELVAIPGKAFLV